MALKEKEIAISKSCSVKLDDDTIAIIAHVYHTANKKNNPTDHSWYRYIGRVVKIKDLEAEIQDKKSVEHRLENWTWNSPIWPDDWYFGYDNGNTKAKEARWLSMKLKKTLSWDAYLKLVKEGIKTLATTGKEKQHPTAIYETTGYIDSNGQQYDITNKDDLIKLQGIFFWKDCPLKKDNKN